MGPFKRAKIESRSSATNRPTETAEHLLFVFYPINLSMPLIGGKLGRLCAISVSLSSTRLSGRGVAVSLLCD